MHKLIVGCHDFSIIINVEKIPVFGYGYTLLGNMSIADEESLFFVLKYLTEFYTVTSESVKVHSYGCLTML